MQTVVGLWPDVFAQTEHGYTQYVSQTKDGFGPDDGFLQSEQTEGSIDLLLNRKVTLKNRI